MSLRSLAYLASLSWLTVGTAGIPSSFAKPPELPVNPAVDCQKPERPAASPLVDDKHPQFLPGPRSRLIDLDLSELAPDVDDEEDALAPYLLLQWTPQGIRVIQLHPIEEEEDLLQVELVDSFGFALGISRGVKEATEGLTSDEGLKKVAVAASKSTPKMIDEETELTTVTAQPHTIVYTYTLVKRYASEINVLKFQDILKPKGTATIQRV